MSSDWKPVILVMLGGIALSVGGFILTDRYYRGIEERAFEAAASRLADAIKGSAQRYVEAVSAVATFVTASDRIDRWEFMRFADLTLPRYPGLAALAWVPRVALDERNTFEASVQRDGLFGLTIREASISGNLKDAGQRSEYLPIAYLVPFDGNEAALNFDLGSEPRYRRVLEAAGDAGRLLASEALVLSQLRQSGASVWLTLPLYARDSAASNAAERRSALIGFAIGILRLEEFLSGAFEIADSANVRFAIFDRTDGTSGSALFQHAEAELTGLEPGVPVNRRELDIAGRQWLLLSTVGAERSWKAADLLPWNVALVAAMLTGLLVQHMSNAVLHRRNIEQVIRRRTAELSRRNAELATEMERRAQTEIRLRAAKEQAESANRAKSDFLAAVSHELRTPLNAIIGFSALLSGESGIQPDETKSRGYAGDIHRSGKHLLALINDILDLSKAESGSMDMIETPVDPASVIAGCLAIVRGRAEEGGLELKADLPADLPPFLADERRLKQVLLNLLSNAIKFTPTGGRVAVGAAVTETGLEITVADTGIGIPEADIERVFQPFVQLDSSLARKYEGTGLGLALSRHWVHLHGGSLTLASEPGNGTTAMVRFPNERLRRGDAPSPSVTGAPPAPARAIGSDTVEATAAE